MRKFTLTAALALLWFASGAIPTEKFYLSGTGSDHTVEWDFYCTGGRNSGRWTKIAVPSCWELQGFGAYNYGHDKPKADEKGLYKFRFRVPAEWRGRTVNIVFEGSMTDTEIKVNGRSAGPVHQGAYYRFKRDVTNLLKYGAENLLEVTVSKQSANASVTGAERDADYWVFGGIYRPVFLEALPAQHIAQLATDARANGAYTLDVELGKALPGATVAVTVRDAAGKQVGSQISSSVPVPGAKARVAGRFRGIEPWSAEHPNLYTATVTLSHNGKELHTVTQKFGFRTIEVREADGIYVNGRRMMFRGVNRCPIWPTTGRTTSYALSVQDVKLIREMNMNAVRMSHYPPDQHFLDVCDSLGLYVIDELCAWQKPSYDDQVGSILAQEMLRRDVNHPSIVVWANGNEGGFNFNLDHFFDDMDPQSRPVIHPWSRFRLINTQHYISYNSGLSNMFNGRDIFMPTELIHGLYDGGHGAGLDDYWNLMRSNPLSAGMFLWDFADQGIVRTDKDGILDTDTNHGADGIVGPYREKEGSFFTIKEVWSPLFVARKVITPSWDGRLTIENRYDFTNASQCSFTYELRRFNSLKPGDVTSHKGQIASPDIAPGSSGTIRAELPGDWTSYDVFYLTTRDDRGEDLFTYSIPISDPASVARRWLVPVPAQQVKVSEQPGEWVVSSGDKSYTFDRATGYLTGVKAAGKTIPFRNGPRFVSDYGAEFISASCEQKDGVTVIKAVYKPERGGKNYPPYEFTWTVTPGGGLTLDWSYKPVDRFDLLGVTFDYPEGDVTGVEMMARGPYRVYKNRMKGMQVGVWEKSYNNTVTGESWIYPEFKGFYADLYGVRFLGKTPFTVVCSSRDIFLHLFTPEAQKGAPARNYTLPVYPAGDISFLHAITPVGTKFRAASDLGPQSDKNVYKISGDPELPEGHLTFLF